jgi:hypothetical protein
MWPRILELLIAGWLAISPFVFGHFPKDRTLWLNDFLCAFLIAACALLSLGGRMRWAHLAELPLALWLLAMGYLGRAEPLPALQNHILLAFALLMIAVIPSDANRPPLRWQEAGLR